GVNPDVVFHAFKSHFAVGRPKTILRIIFPPLARINGLELHLAGQKVYGRLLILVQPAHSLNHPSHEAHRHRTIFFRPRPLRHDHIGLKVRDTVDDSTDYIEPRFLRGVVRGPVEYSTDYIEARLLRGVVERHSDRSGGDLTGLQRGQVRRRTPSDYD